MIHLSSLCGIWMLACLLLRAGLVQRLDPRGRIAGGQFRGSRESDAAGSGGRYADPGRRRVARCRFARQWRAENRPIVIRAATPGKVVLSGESRLRLAGSYLQVEGLSFERGHHDGDVISFRADSKRMARHCRITQCAVRDYNGPDKKQKDTKWVSIYGTQNRFDHCHLTGKTSPGTTLVVWLADEPNGHQIDHNYFGPRPSLGENGGETIRVGDSNWSQHSSQTLVESNLFERCNGEIEIVSNKSCDNVYRGNTFVECEGALTLRHGNRCTVEGNFFFGNGKKMTGGVRIIGEDHRIVNNYFQRLGVISLALHCAG